ncbi:RsmE family RNA methyltransferase [Alicyclobacillus mengziensis]|uniref:Ribosomal RNA small subunit methyltransferase E n=1 Tax=Alicyclobacillus mengziensis TaxID=2931921 RepID=A0A9X7Z4L8_9BACL|nr:RsmE family RNA methyltransferase [Alicyclobacillus mengziensis]QSO46114.1 16S rRNA (uracil(1498)-N(3))-methyltransferase [Alicyclobacillus mengziensis]
MNPRVFLEVDHLSPGERVKVGGEDGHHLVRVLRVGPLESVAIGAAGRGYLTQVESIDAKAGTVTLRVQNELSSHEAKLKVYLLQGMPKAEKTEFIIQHGTELGLNGFLLYQSNRAVARLDGKDAKKQTAKLVRWERVIREAAGQSQRDVVPTLAYAASWSELEKWLTGVAPGLILFLDEEEQALSLKAALTSYAEDALAEQFSQNASAVNASAEEESDGSVRPVVLCIGPEGGWDDNERQSFIQRLGAVPVTLGPRILRTETAGLVGAAAVFYHFHALGG